MHAGEIVAAHVEMDGGGMRLECFQEAAAQAGELGEAFDAGWRATGQGWIYVGGHLFGSCAEKSDLTMETLIWSAEVTDAMVWAPSHENEQGRVAEQIRSKKVLL